MKKIDPRLRYLMSQSTSRTFDSSESIGFEQAAEPPKKIEVLLRCIGTNPEQSLKSLGMRVRSVVQGFYTVISGEVTLDILQQLNQQDFVLQVEASRPMLAELDISRVEVRAPALNLNTSSVTGAGVIVGIIDGSIDYTHPCFRHEDNSSRILYLWDQGGLFDPNGTVPYGREYTQADLNAALASTDPWARVPHKDWKGHGTHVAGIAAGNQNAGNQQFYGIAPSADLIVVAYKNEGVTIGQSIQAFDAFNYIVQRANSRPVAINLSQGMNGGGHSGETILETALNNLARQPNVIIVKSAGNEQISRSHAGGQITEGQTVTIELLIDTNKHRENTLELWYDGIDGISIAIQPPGSFQLPFVAIGEEREFSTLANNHVFVSHDLDADETGDTRATIILSSGQVSFIQPGIWRLLLRGDRVELGRYDIWIERTQPRCQFSEVYVDSTRTISIPGTAKRIITVGSYVTRPEEGSSSPQGQISSFSSRGPTRYGLQKPEIAAPGEMIISARSCQSDYPSNPDEWHTAMPGTSMAAPHVAGAAALILEVRPGLICEQVKQILTRTARGDGFASSAPDNTWGYGKLDIEAALQCAKVAHFPIISNVRVTGATVSWETDIPTTGAIRFQTHKRWLELGKNVGSQVDLTLSRNHSLTLSGLSQGRYYCEIIAFSTDEWWSVDDNAEGFYILDI